MRRPILTATVLAAGLTAAIPAAAQDAPAAPAAEQLPKWTDVGELGWVATSGNSESSSFSLKNTLVRKGEHDLFELKLGAVKVTTSDIRLYAVQDPGGGDPSREEDKDSRTTAENYYLNGRYDRDIAGRMFWFAGAGWDRNTPAGIQNRYVAFAGVGHNWFEGERRKWRTDYSATGTKQENVVDDPTFADTFVGVRLTSTFLQKFGDNGIYGNDTIFDQNLDETSDWRVDMTNWVSLNMNEHLALKVSLQWLYDHLPSLKEVNLYPATDPGGAGTPIGTDFVEVDDLDSIFTTALVIKY